MLLATGAPRLFDLVKIKDDALRPAFFFAMGNTVVAADLDQATRIAYGQDSRFRRVVTLQVRGCGLRSDISLPPMCITHGQSSTNAYQSPIHVCHNQCTS